LQIKESRRVTHDQPTADYALAIHGNDPVKTVRKRNRCDMAIRRVRPTYSVEQAEDLVGRRLPFDDCERPGAPSALPRRPFRMRLAKPEMITVQVPHSVFPQAPRLRLQRRYNLRPVPVMKCVQRVNTLDHERMLVAGNAGRQLALQA